MESDAIIEGRMPADHGDVVFRLLSTLRGHSEQVRSLTFSPDGSLLLAASLDGTVYIWDTARSSLLHVLTDSEVPRPQFGRTPLPRVSFAPDGKSLAASIGNGLIRIYNGRGELVHVLSEAGWYATDAIFTPSGKHLITADRRGEVRFWDVSTWQCVRRFHILSPSPHALDSDLPIRHLTPSYDGRFLALVIDREPGSVLMYTLAQDDFSEVLVAAALEHGYALSEPAFSSDGSTLAVADPVDGCGIILDVHSLESVATCYPDNDIAVAARFALGGHLLALAGGNRGIVWLWDTRSSQFVGGIPAHTGGWSEDGPTWKIDALAISTADDMLATAGMDRPVGISAEQPYYGPVDWTIKLWAISRV